MKHKIIRLILLAFIIRLALSPFAYHPWEYRTYNNTCADIHNGVNPYDHFWELTKEVRNNPDYSMDYYEYWAYSPAGLAWLAVVSPLNPEPIEPFSDIDDQTPDPLLCFLFKIPSIIADLVCGYLLFLIVSRCKYGNPFKIMKYWLLMPLPWFFSAVWGGFDSIVLAAILASIYLIQSYKWAGLSLGFGIAIKTIPIFVLPVFLRRYRIKNWPYFISCIGVIMLSACLYYLLVSPGELIGAMIGFHGNRYGGGLTIYNIWQLGQENIFWDIVFSFIWLFPLIGGWLYIWLKHSIDPIRGCLLSLLWFVIASKLVNPAYMLYVFPFLLIYVRSFKQLMFWQIMIMVWIFCNIGFMSFFAYPLDTIGLDVWNLPIEKSYMANLGFGWLIWILNILLFMDVLKMERNNILNT